MSIIKLESQAQLQAHCWKNQFVLNSGGETVTIANLRLAADKIIEFNGEWLYTDAAESVINSATDNTYNYLYLFYKPGSGDTIIEAEITDEVPTWDDDRHDYYYDDKLALYRGFVTASVNFITPVRLENTNYFNKYVQLPSSVLVFTTDINPKLTDSVNIDGVIFKDGTIDREHLQTYFITGAPEVKTQAQWYNIITPYLSTTVGDIRPCKYFSYRAFTSVGVVVKVWAYGYNMERTSSTKITAYGRLVITFDDVLNSDTFEPVQEFNTGNATATPVMLMLL